MNTATTGLLAVAAGSVALRLVDWFVHRDAQPALRRIGMAAETRGAPRNTARPWDAAIAVVPFALAWCDIAFAVILAGSLPRVVGLPVLAVVAAARFRFLQEVGHTALHGALCRSRRWQWLLADIFVNGPLFRPDSSHRFVAHVRQHHPHVNDMDLDPNIARFIRVGFVPGLTSKQFTLKLVHPLTPFGIGETLVTMATNLRLNRSAVVVVVRAASVIGAVTFFVVLGGVDGLVAGYLLPLITLYPLFSWISLLVEHRWFVPDPPADRRTRECTLGRPTEYPGLAGWLLSRAMFPASDRWHLAHSLYPGLRWNYLEAVDRSLRRVDREYVRYASVGLLRRHPPHPSSLSDLRDRMTAPHSGDQWIASRSACTAASSSHSCHVSSEAIAHAAARA